MPVTPNMKISEVLKRYPQLLEVLLDQSPAFKPLRNPVLRRVQSRLVNVSQAAAMGGIDQAKLIRTLNAAIGEDEPIGEDAANPPQSSESPEEPGWVASAPVAVDLDVREDQRRGTPPLQAILSTAVDIPVGHILGMRNTFEPLPLYDLLAKKGFERWSQQIGPEDWRILFYRAGTACVEEAATPAVPSADDWVDPTEVLSIRAEDLQPPGPMMKILDAAGRLQPGQTMLIHHRRRPVYLYARLQEMGLEQHTYEIGPDAVDVLVRRPA